MLIYVSANNSYVAFSPKQLQQSGVAAWREGYRSSTWTHDAAVEAREDQDDCARASAMRKFVDKMITLVSRERRFVAQEKASVRDYLREADRSHVVR
ncbi:unnamed protein product [Brassica oleracea var. botrytis]